MSSAESKAETSYESIDEEARRRFEKARHEGSRTPLEDFLPALDHPHYRATLEELVLIELEFDWKTWCRSDGETAADPAKYGSRPVPVEAYLTRFPILNRPDFLRRLLEQEFRVRRRYGEGTQLDPLEYQRRFPDIDLSAETFSSPSASPYVAPTLPTLPGFEILGVLGRGAMGVVYKARQLRLDRVVAIKMILAGAHADVQELVRFRAEAEAVARLQHPNVAQIHEVGDCGGLPYFVLEYLEGGSLADLLAHSPPTPRRAAEVIEVLARAMAFSHQRGIIHRDLKPANVLLTADGTPKVADFGLAKRLEGSQGRTQSGTVLGTPSYMAPEQAAGRTRLIGPAADVYALGAILYELLTGKPPFRCETTYDTLVQVMSAEPVAPRRLRAGVPRDLEVICLKCLEKEPARRYASASALAEDLTLFLRDEPISARPIRGLPRWWRWCRRKPVEASLMAVVALLLLVMGTTFTVIRTKDSAKDIGMSARGFNIAAALTPPVESPKEVAPLLEDDFTNKAVPLFDERLMTFRQVDGAAVLTAKANGVLPVLYSKPRVKDFVAEFAARAPGGVGGFGLFFRSITVSRGPLDAYWMLLIRPQENAVSLWCWQDPKWTVVKTFPLPAGLLDLQTDTHVRLEVTGNEFRVSVNGTLACEYTDATQNVAGLLGLCMTARDGQADTVYFRGLRVYPPVARAPPNEP